MLKEALIFAGGVVLGSAGMYLGLNGYLKRHYEEKSQQEIDDVKRVYLAKCRKADDIRKMEEVKEKIAISNKDIEDATEVAKVIKKTVYSIINANGYSSEENEEDDEDSKWEREREESAPTEHPDHPYTITPDQFNYENRHYEKVTLLYYPYGGELVNEITDQIEDIQMTIGEDALSDFGEYEPDVVFVRNDQIGIDYEVLRQPKHSIYISGDEYN